MNETILVVEDDPGISKVIALYLRQNQYTVVVAESGAEARRRFKETRPDLIIMDVLLPDTNGVALCAEISEEANIPIIFLSSKQEDEDIIAGLKSGGVDYVTKPFNPSVLVARVEAGLRRLQAAASVSPHTVQEEKVLRFKHLAIDLKTFELRIDGVLTPIYAMELKLLVFFLKHPNQLYSMTELFEQVWGDSSISSDATVMVHISNLRKKIEPDPRNPRYIVTVKGVGYKFVTR